MIVIPSGFGYPVAMYSKQDEEQFSKIVENCMLGPEKFNLAQSHIPIQLIEDSVFNLNAQTPTNFISEIVRYALDESASGKFAFHYWCDGKGSVLTTDDRVKGSRSKSASQTKRHKYIRSLRPKLNKNVQRGKVAMPNMSQDDPPAMQIDIAHGHGPANNPVQSIHHKIATQLNHHSLVQRAAVPAELQRRRRR